MILEITTEKGNIIQIPVGNLEAFSDPIEEFITLDVPTPSANFQIFVGV